MKTRKDIIRNTALYTFHGLPDPRLEGAESRSTFKVSFIVDAYLLRLKKFLEPIGLSKAKG